jgi:hypothetical protein
MVDGIPQQPDPVVLYRIRRGPDGVHAWAVSESGAHIPLPHLMRHSPDGFEIGYAGSGPSDLARSIVGHFLGEKDPDSGIYQALKFALLANPGFREGVDIHVSTVAGIVAAYRRHTAPDAHLDEEVEDRLSGGGGEVDG